MYDLVSDRNDMRKQNKSNQEKKNILLKIILILAFHLFNLPYIDHFSAIPKILYNIK